MAGITIEVAVFLMMVGITSYYYIVFRLNVARCKSMDDNNLPHNPSRSRTTRIDGAFLRKPPSPNPHGFPPDSPEDPTSSPYSAQGEQSRIAHTRIFITSRGHRTFMTFLSSYGPGGVSLRELIMLTMLRQAGRESRNHWLMSGEGGTLEEAAMSEIKTPKENWIFNYFVSDGVVDHDAIESFQAFLEHSNGLYVRYPEETQSDEASRYWHTDGRIWIVRENRPIEASASVHEIRVFRRLLDLFIRMPDKDVSLAAQRQREVYYYHAHLLMRRVIRSWRLPEESPKLLIMQAVFVTLQLLTHRYRSGDSLLLDFVRKHSIHSLRPDMSVMLLWAELKETAFRKDYDSLCTIKDRALELMNSTNTQSHATPRQNGFLGFVLVDLIKSAKALHFEDLVADALKAGTKWVDSAQSTATSIEKTALCGMLATLGIHARKEIIQTEYYLFYGYHLSRAGFLEQGDHFLARGLRGRELVPWWSYEMERVSNALRLGRQSEAVQMLKSLRELALQYRDTGRFKELMEPRHRSVLWKHSGKRALDWKHLRERAEPWKCSGECAEVFVLLNLYEADCSASAGRLDDACAKLRSGISITTSVYDTYVRILRITLEMRLLEILMRQGSYQEALPVATNLASEILDERTSSTLASDVVYCIAQQLLNLSNTLSSAGEAAASMALLKSITSIGDLVRHSRTGG